MKLGTLHDGDSEAANLAVQALKLAQHESIHPIRAARWLKAWTQIQLARQSRVCARTIHGVESREHAVSYPVRKRLLAALDLPWDRHREFFPSARQERK